MASAGSAPAELLVSRDFCQYIFRRPDLVVSRKVSMDLV
ncbi:hypothetical protein Nmel_006305 [Mimus melanotis]